MSFKIVRVKIDGERRGRKLYIRSEDIKLMESLEKGAYDGHLRLISPFDNILSNRERAKTMFNFSSISIAHCGVIIVGQISHKCFQKQVIP